MSEATFRMIAAAIGVLIIAGALLWATFARGDGRLEVDTAIVFVADVSGSMTDGEVSMVRRAHAEAITSPEVLSAIADSATGRVAVAYVEFGAYALPRIDWTLIAGPGDARGFAGDIRALPVGRVSNLTSHTHIGAGLMLAVETLDRLPWPALRLVVDVIGDGVAEDEAIVMVAAAELAARGATVNAIPLLDNAPYYEDAGKVRAFYETYVKSGPGSFVWELTAIADLPMALRQKIVLELY